MSGASRRPAGPDRARRRLCAGLPAAAAAALLPVPGAARAGDAPFEPVAHAALAPVELVDLDGAPVSLASLRGRPVLLNLWATWCEPCRAEMPSLDALRAVGDDELHVIALNVGEASERIRRYLKRSDLGLTAWRAPQSVLRAWGVRILPTSFVLDAQGRVRLRVTGARDWSDAATRDAIASLGPGRPRR